MERKFVNYTRNNAYDSQLGALYPPSWPNEMLVKILSSSNYRISNFQPKSGKKVLEIGCFAGNNIRFLNSLGLNCYGVEINRELLEMCYENLKRLKIAPPPTLSLGDNNALPYPNEFFDLLVSINTLHYSAKNSLLHALDEFKRVVKPGGYLIIETAGNKHFAVEQSQRIKEFEWIWKSGGFRQDNYFSFFDSVKHFEAVLKTKFDCVHVGERFELYPTTKLHFFIAQIAV